VVFIVGRGGWTGDVLRVVCDPIVYYRGKLSFLLRNRNDVVYDRIE